MSKTLPSVTRTAVLKEMKRVNKKHFKKEGMTAKKFFEHATISEYSLIKHFDTWQHALSVANIKKASKYIRITEKTVVKELRKVYFAHFEHNRMKKQDFALYSSISYIAVRRHFNTWDDALNKADINCFPECFKYDEKTIIAELRRVYFQYYENKRMVYEQFRLHGTIGQTTIWKYFGMWENALNCAGINCKPKPIRYDDDQVVAELKRVYFTYYENTRMTRVAFTIHSGIQNFRLMQQFESWDDALTHANINYIPEVLTPEKKRAQVMADLLRIKESNKNQYFNFIVYKQNKGMFSSMEIFELFECKSWEVLLNKNLALFKYKRVFSDKELFDEVKRFWDKLGRRPTFYEFREKSNIKMVVYEKEFTTWTLCIEKFCLKYKSYNSSEDGNSFQTSKKLLVEELKKIKKLHIKQTLKFKDYKQLGGKYSRFTFVEYFGSWQNALKLVGLKPVQTTSILPKNELLFDELQNIINELGRNPLPFEIETIGKYPYRYYVQRFGGVKKSLLALAESLETKSK